MAITLADSIDFVAPSSNTRTKPRKYKIIFIPGNPGLIEYYRTFLTHLYSILNPSSSSSKIPTTEFHIHGFSIPGFEISNPEEGANEDQRKAWGNVGLKHDPPFGLPEVINAAEQNVLNICGQSSSDDDGGDQEPGVILIGHSLGAYIALEVIQRHRLRLESLSKVVGEPRVVGAIGLFPTVVDIGKSQKGKVLTTLTQIPFFQTLAPLFATIFLSLLPFAIAHFLVCRITRFPEHCALATTRWLKSKYGVKQSLFMGRDEMAQITTDRWTDDLWGAAYPSPTGVPRPKLFFYFGERDHWVADRTRDELLRLRGRGEGGEKWKPKMEIDGNGIPHGFCIDHSVTVAEKVAGYLREIVEADGMPS